MRLWQHADACGKLRYSLIPASDDAAKAEEGKIVLSSSPTTCAQVEKSEDRSSGPRSGGCDAGRRTTGSPLRSHRAIDSYACDKCDVKFPMRSMLKRHKLTHNVRLWLRGRCPRPKYAQQLRAYRRAGASKARKRLRRVPGKSVVCAFCDFGCKRSATLTAHVRGKHADRQHEATKADARNKQPRQQLSCTICGHECASERNLMRHMLKHRSKSDAASFACDSCDFKCKRSTTLASHLARNHKKAKRDPSTRRRATRYNHTSSSKKTSPSVARPQNREAAAEKAAAASAAISQDEAPELLVIKEEVDVEDCGAGGGGEVSANAAAQPDAAQASQKSVQVHCDLCDFTCSKKSTLYSHKRRHKVENEVFACNECSFKTMKRSSMYSHIKRKHKEPPPPRSACSGGGGDGGGEARQPELFRCGQCEYKNKNKYELKVHMARKHSDDFKFSCETCGKKFKVKGDLTNHIRFSHREQPVICDVCGKTCLNSNSLYVHQKFAHYKAKYECPLCKRRMVSAENLSEHMLRQHERRENVVCEECGKTFSRNSRLKVHMRIHTGDKPYSCTVCSKSFARRTALKQHLLIHTGIRPYVCDICGKAFTQKPGLISHRKSHPGSHPPLPRVLIDHILNDVMNA